MNHSILSASSAYRWMACPGSIRMCQGLESKSSTFAEEGSAAHFLAEQCLIKGEQNAAVYQDRVIRRVKKGFSLLKEGAKANEEDHVVTEDMAQAVQVYLDTIRDDITRAQGAELRVEERFDLSGLYPGMFGTNDACLSEPFGKLVVYDYKHGAGYPVEVMDNPQLLYYALGASHSGDFESIELVIVQPRARHKDGPVRRWELTPEELQTWAKKELIPAARKTEDPEAPVVSGGWCRFCPALATCPAMLNKAIETAQSDFAAVPLPSPEALNRNDLIKVLQSAELLKTWLKAVEAHAQSILEKGEKLPGFKLVRKKTNRVWTDESTVINRLFKFRDEIYEKKLMSPAKLDKLVKQKGWGIPIEDLIEKPEGGLTIAPEADRREAVQTYPTIEFLNDEDFLN